MDIATRYADEFPQHMRDLVISWTIDGFIGNRVAMMVLDKLYENGIFKPLTENELVTTNLIMFSDKLPE